jgi:hypothetical protein
MPNWIFIGTIEPTTEWQFTTFAAGSWFKVEQVRPPNDIDLQVCQSDGSVLYVEPALLQSEPGIQIICLACPGPINENRRLGFKIPGLNLSPGWQIKLYSTDTPMPLFRTAPTIASAMTSTTATPTTVPAATTSTQLLAVNPSRKGAVITNTSTGTLSIQLGAVVSAASFAVQLLTGDTYEVPFGFTGAVNGLWASVNGNAQVIELS